MTNEELFEAKAFERLYTENLAFMHYVSRRFMHLGIEQEELIGCGHLAFAKSLKTFDPKQSKWITYFSKVMVNEILMLNRKQLRHKENVSLEEFSFGILERSTPIGLEDEAINRMTLSELMRRIETKSLRERRVFLLHLQGKKQKDIAETMNVSQAQISRMISKLQGELKQTYQKGA